MFVSSLSPDVCRRAHVLFTLFEFVCVYWCPTRIMLCFVCLVYNMLPVCLDCPFLNTRNGGVMHSVLTSGAVDRGFEARSDQTKDYTIGIYCFSVKPAVLIKERERERAKTD